MQFGKLGRYCICYKAQTKHLEVYSRKYVQGLRGEINTENLEGSKGVEIPAMNGFLMYKKDTLHFYDSTTFQERPELMIKI